MGWGWVRSGSALLGLNQLASRALALAGLQSMDATVTVCHSRTPDIAAHCRRADIVIAAIGKPEFVQGDWLKPGCTVRIAKPFSAATHITPQLTTYLKLRRTAS